MANEHASHRRPDPPDSQPRARSGPPSPAPLSDEHADGVVHGENETFVTAMSRSLPFVISMFFHLGIALIFAFVTLLVTQDRVEDLTPSGPVSIVPSERFRERHAEAPVEREAPTEVQANPHDRPVIPQEPSGGEGEVETIQIGGPGPQRPGEGGKGLTIGTGTGLGFFGTPAGDGGQPVQNVVYVVDCSGSMHDTFDVVVREIIVSIGRLDRTKSFHVLFFRSGEPLENPPKRLMPATAENKRDLVDFLQTVIPAGQTDAVPALRRGLQVAHGGKTGERSVVYFLTDGAFPDNGAVLRVLAEHNPRRDVIVHTFLFQYRAEHAVAIMQRIAQENGGAFKYVSLDE